MYAVVVSRRPARPVPKHNEPRCLRILRGGGLAVATMKKGEKATVTIKPEYGYGKKSMGKIPANSTLTFEMELVDFRESSGGGCCVIS